MDKKCFERIVSGALAASMTFTLVPVSAFAASPLQTTVPPPQTVFLSEENSGVTALQEITEIPTNSDGEPTGTGIGWNYDSSTGTLTIQSGYKLVTTGEIKCDKIKIEKGAEIGNCNFTQLSSVTNNGTISGGSFDNPFTLQSQDYHTELAVTNNGDITDGKFGDETFSGMIVNNGNISGGWFGCEMTRAFTINNCSTISGGEFQGDLTNKNGAVFSQGTVFGVLTNETGAKVLSGFVEARTNNTGEILGGEFQGSVTNEGTISGGIYTGTVTNNGTVNGGIFSAEITGSYLLTAPKSKINEAFTDKAYVVGQTEVKVKSTAKGNGTWESADMEIGTTDQTTQTATFTMPGDHDVTLSFTFGDNDLVIENGVPTMDGGTNWEYKDGTLYLNDGAKLSTTETVTCPVNVASGAEIAGGTFEKDIYNNGTISGGTFKGIVNSDNKISGGTFNGKVIAKGPVSGGTFTSDVEAADASITGGEFKGKVEITYNYDGSRVSGGTFSGEVTIDGNSVVSGDARFTTSSSVTVDSTGKIAGGTFEGAVKNGGTISGGIFSGNITSVAGSKITGGTFLGKILSISDNSITGGVFAASTSEIWNAMYTGAIPTGTVYNVINIVDETPGVKVNDLITTDDSATSTDIKLLVVGDETELTVTHPNGAVTSFTVNGETVDAPDGKLKLTESYGSLVAVNPVLGLTFENGTPVGKGSKTSGWTYENNTLTLYGNFGTLDADTDIKCKSVVVEEGAEIANGKFTNVKTVTNKGTISGGYFNISDAWFPLGESSSGKIDVTNTGTITGGYFGNETSSSKLENSGNVSGGSFGHTEDKNCMITNTGKISDGTFYGFLYNQDGAEFSGGTVFKRSTNNAGAKISGGTFEDQVDNSGKILDGTFEKIVDNKDSGEITGGTFKYSVTNKGKISDGKFPFSVQNEDCGEISGGTFGYVNNQNGTVSGGVFENGNDWLENFENCHHLSAFNATINEVLEDGAYVVGQQKVTVTPKADGFKSWKGTEKLENVVQTGSTITFTMPEDDVTLSVRYGDNDLKIDETTGRPTMGGGTNWEYRDGGDNDTDSYLYLYDGAVLDTTATVNCRVIVYPGASISDGTFTQDVDNYGIIKGGRFENSLTNLGTIENCVFDGDGILNVSFELTSPIEMEEGLMIQKAEGIIKNVEVLDGDVENYGIIEGGTFENGSKLYNFKGDPFTDPGHETVLGICTGIITGGTFKGNVYNGGELHGTEYDSGVIAGGTFEGTVENNDGGEIAGGIFVGEFVNQMGGKINDGTFIGTFDNKDDGDFTGVFVQEMDGSKSLKILSGSVDGDMTVNGVIDQSKTIYIVGDPEITVEYTGDEEIEKWKSDDQGKTKIMDAKNNALTVKYSEISGRADAAALSLTPLAALRFVDGKPTTKGDKALGWTYEDGKLTLEEDFVFDQDVTVSCDVQNYGQIAKGKFTGTVTNDGIIMGGTFKDLDNHSTVNGGKLTGTVNNDGTLTGLVVADGSSQINNKPDGTIGMGSFNGSVTNDGTIETGDFIGKVENNGTIKKGDFTGEVENTGKIEDGSFEGDVTNSGDGEIAGGDFAGKVENNGKSITGGVFAEKPTGTATNLVTLTAPAGCTIDGKAATQITSVKGKSFEVEYTGSNFTEWEITGAELDNAKANPVTITLGDSDVTLTLKKEESKPSTPGETEKPGETDKPSTPSEPSKPGETDKPSTPSEPSKPGETDKPSTPSEPSKPGETDKPSTPSEPSKPGETDKPSTPSEPSKPGETDKPSTPGETEKPGETDKPSTPSEPEQSDSGAGALLVGGALVAGGVATGVIVYNVAMDVIKSALPEGAAIPETREQLAAALWEKAGKPEVAVEEGVVLTDTEKAMRWAIEKQLISAEGEDSVSKIDVLVAAYKANTLSVNA